MGGRAGVHFTGIVTAGRDIDLYLEFYSEACRCFVADSFGDEKDWVICVFVCDHQGEEVP